MSRCKARVGLDGYVFVGIVTVDRDLRESWEETLSFSLNESPFAPSIPSQGGVVLQVK